MNHNCHHHNMAFSSDILFFLKKFLTSFLCIKNENQRPISGGKTFSRKWSLLSPVMCDWEPLVHTLCWHALRRFYFR